MSVLDWFRSESKQFRATFLPRAGGATAVAQAHYVRLWVVEMMLADGRKLFDKYTPAVHGAVRFTAGQQTREIATIAGPAALPGLSKVEGDVVHDRRALTGLVPFAGGQVELGVGLVRYRKGDGAVDALIELLGSLSGLLKLPDAGTLAKVANPVREGIQRLAGAGDRSLLLSYHADHAGDAAAGGHPLQAGYVAIIRSDKPGLVSVVNDQLFVDGQPLRQTDAMLLAVEVAETRDDWQSFGAWSALLEAAVDAERGGNPGQARTLLEQARKAIRASEDLTANDRKRVWAAVEQEFAEQTSRGAGLAPSGGGSFLERALAAGPTPAEAATLPAP
ncbi:MAG: hypothetical protein KC549_11295 [Myxococcales bacterium]|nr:hypothetical protein [Myxococcales bacterium]